MQGWGEAFLYGFARGDDLVGGLLKVGVQPGDILLRLGQRDFTTTIRVHDDIDAGRMCGFRALQLCGRGRNAVDVLDQAAIGLCGTLQDFIGDLALLTDRLHRLGHAKQSVLIRLRLCRNSAGILDAEGFYRRHQRVNEMARAG